MLLANQVIKVFQENLFTTKIICHIIIVIENRYVLGTKTSFYKNEFVVNEMGNNFYIICKRVM